MLNLRSPRQTVIKQQVEKDQKKDDLIWKYGSIIAETWTRQPSPGVTRARDSIAFKAADTAQNKQLHGDSPQRLAKARVF